MVNDEVLFQKALKIKMLITDIDGVWTDAGVYYSSKGEELKRFSVRDGMGVERLKNYANIETGIITGENSLIVSRRAEKLNIRELHLGIKNKFDIFEQICRKRNLLPEEIAYIGDDSNDMEVLMMAGLSACPNDAMPFIKDTVDYITEHGGGYGAFRDFCELIIILKSNRGKYAISKSRE
jgi:YrbI family 3-deoxy-D-manno-octulosonate 8-phosphate phosphatase